MMDEREELIALRRMAELEDKEKAAYSPLNDMSTGEKLAAAAGSGAASVLRAVGATGLVSRLGLPATKEEADKQDATLMATTPGKVGRFLGQAGSLIPAILLPGANTYAGSAIIGAGVGGATTEGDLAERGKAALGGAVGGVGGKAVGDLVGTGVRKVVTTLGTKGASKQAANAGTDAALTAARNAGYKVTPSMAGRGGPVTSALQGLGGKIKLQQQASIENQQVTNRLAAKALGLAPDERITPEVLDTLRQRAGAAYADISKMGKLPASTNDLPRSVGVKSFTDKLTLGRRTEVDAADLISNWKQANADATGYYRAYGRDANPETLAKAKAASAVAKQIDDWLVKNLPDQAKALKAARVNIAKTYSVEDALNPTTGNINAAKLVRQLDKGKMLSGGLKDAAEFARAFPKAAQSGVDVPAYSPLDGFAVGQGNALLSLMTLHRPAARAALLSKPYQGLLTAPKEYGPGLLSRSTSELIDSPLARLLAITGGQTAGANAAK